MRTEASSDACPQTLLAGGLVADPFSALQSDVAIEVRRGVIERVYPRQQVPAGARVRDLGDVVVTAGVIDAHVHLGFDGSEHPETTMRGGDRARLDALIARNAEALVRSGVTTVRDLGCVGVAVSAAAAAWRFDPRYPRVVAANQPLTTTRGHCSYMASECDDVGSLLRAVRQRHDEGAQVVKIMLTGGFMHSEGDTPYRSVYDLETLRQVVTAAHALDMSVAVHAHGTQGIIVAVEAGADSVEHCSMATRGGVDVDPAVLALMRSTHVIAVPTVSSVWDDPLPWAPRADAIEVISRLHQAGVPLALGTDSGIPGVPPGDHVAGLRVLAEAGLSGTEQWAAATVHAAAVCRLAGQVGRVQSGFAADLLALDADPREDPSTLGRVRVVFRAGIPVPEKQELVGA